MSRKPWLRWALALLLVATAAWLSIRRVHWATLQAVLARADLVLLALAWGTILLTTTAKSARWRVLLRTCDAQARGARILRILFIGQMANSFLPTRLGDVARAAMIGPQANGGIPAVLGTIVVEKVLDGAMGLLILIGLIWWTPLPDWLRGPVLTLSAVTGILLALLALAAAQHERAARFYRWLTGWLPERAQRHAHLLMASFALGLRLFKQPGETLRALGWSVVIWSVAALTNVVAMAALGIRAPGWSAWLVLVTGYVATFLPTVPVQIGVFEYACVLSLTAAGVSQEEALAFGLVLHLLVISWPALLGPIGLAVEGLSWSRFRQAQSSRLKETQDSLEQGSAFA
jgi:uncharacterized protein (TIRG00374 family)